MPFPLLYEINTRCWLRDLAEKQGRPVDLGDVPTAEFESWRSLGFTHIWLMGVWTTGPRARECALNGALLRQAYSAALPSWTEADIGASPYAIADYKVSPALGGEEGLSLFREHLHAHDLKLILDFVPNHLGLDHPWVSEQPSLFVQSPGPAPGAFRQATTAGPRWLMHGKDPYFTPWTDTVQLDYRRRETRAAMGDQLQRVAERCDGVRCDMAMLVLSDVFSKTWAHLPISEPADAGEFWAEEIARARRSQPQFLFLAEVYWGLEQRLQSLGFDFTYDKELYDRLLARDGPGAQRRLLSLPEPELAAAAHFLENHDEPRVASVLTPEQHRAAALLILILPGLRLLHEGQLTGASRRVPVQMVRRPAEPINEAVAGMYRRFLSVAADITAGQGRVLTPRAAWESNPTGTDILLIEWRTEEAKFNLVAVNFAAHRSQCYTPGLLPGGATGKWRLRDLLGTETHEADARDLRAGGLYLDLEPYAVRVYRAELTGA